MAFFEDLSRYTYRSHEVPNGTSILNVGWLDGAHEFPKSTPEDAFVDALWDFCAVLVDPLRGFHACEVCGSSVDSGPLRVKHGGLTRELGFAEIRVFDPTNGVIYAAPNMVFHYVTRHRYDPPEGFKSAALGLRPASKAYMELLQLLKVRFWDERDPEKRTRGGPRPPRSHGPQAPKAP